MHKTICAEIARLTALSYTNRLELYRRLNRAKDFIDDNLSEQITLEQMSEVACLSLHHFLRLFKKVFQETPHQYLTRKRLEMAQDLLRTTPYMISDICTTIGFQSRSSFSWLFRKHIGLSPEAYRMAHKRVYPKILSRQKKAILEKSLVA